MKLAPVIGAGGTPALGWGQRLFRGGAGIAVIAGGLRFIHTAA